MRTDMARVITERTRCNSSLPSQKTGVRIHRYDPEDEYEDFPRRASAARRLDWDDWKKKSFSDHLAPLRRFLTGNLGRPWDAVYREIRERLDARNQTGRHLLLHVKQEVALDCVRGEDGRYYRPGRPWPVQGFYVNPKTRLLCTQGIARRIGSP